MTAAMPIPAVLLAPGAPYTVPLRKGARRSVNAWVLAADVA